MFMKIMKIYVYGNIISPWYYYFVIRLHLLLDKSKLKFNMKPSFASGPQLGEFLSKCAGLYCNNIFLVQQLLFAGMISTPFFILSFFTFIWIKINVLIFCLCKKYTTLIMYIWISSVETNIRCFTVYAASNCMYTVHVKEAVGQCSIDFNN